MKTSIIFFFILASLPSFSNTLNVGTGKTYATPTAAAAVANPGDTILIHPGNYSGPYFISNLHGSIGAPIVIRGFSKGSVVLNAGSEGLHFSDITYVKIQDLVFTGQTGNGMNIDDAGTIPTPSKFVTVTNCDFRNMGAQGNNDFLKLSGLDSFEVSYCSFRKGATGGSGIDMVGCHFGSVHHCTFDSLGSNSIQMKGGSQYLVIRNNTFTDGGQRSLNLGGSTGLSFFRPLDAKFEAAGILVHANVFIRGMAPIAFVGSERVDVSNNTIVMPEKWVMRILQETVDTSRFVPCRFGMFRNNIVYFSAAVTTHVNVGSNTSPNTFLFSHNLWYNSSNPSASTPQLPTPETSAITGQNPVFASAADFRLRSSSPARGSGIFIAGLGADMAGRSFNNPPSRGAYEYNSSSIDREIKRDVYTVYPNPAGHSFYVEGMEGKISCRILNAQGQVLVEKELNSTDNCISLESFPAGIYRLILVGGYGEASSQSILKL